jgi:hypothetical protein
MKTLQAWRLKWSHRLDRNRGLLRETPRRLDIPGPYPERSTHISTFSSESESPFLLPLLLK